MATNDTLGYRTKLLKVARDLHQDDIEAIKFLLAGKIGQAILDNIRTSLDLFKQLEKLGWISPTSFDLLLQLLEGIGRGDLSNILKGVAVGENVPTITASTKVKADEAIDRRVLDLVATHISSDWKRLARMLNISENKLEQIDDDYRKIYEKSTQMILHWSKSSAVSWNLLKGALEELPRFDIIRMVEVNFNDQSSVQNNPPEPPSPGHPAYIQASSSISDENVQYSATSNLRQQFSTLELDDDTNEDCDYAMPKKKEESPASSSVEVVLLRKNEIID